MYPIIIMVEVRTDWSTDEISLVGRQSWLNRRPFCMTHRRDEPNERYGRGLRTIHRQRPDLSEGRLADFIRSEGGARGY